jgi:phage-related minor tail protein
VCETANEPATIASARALAVNVGRGSMVGVLGLVAWAASRAERAARWARIGTGAGRGLSADSALEPPLSLSESVSGGVTLTRGPDEPLFV